VRKDLFPHNYYYGENKIKQMKDNSDHTLVSSLAASSNILFIFAADLKSIYLLSTPTVPLSYPLDSLSLALSTRNSLLGSTDSLKLFSKKSKILFADPFPALGSTI
jgi:hypothetical protein